MRSVLTSHLCNQQSYNKHSGGHVEINFRPLASQATTSREAGYATDSTNNWGLCSNHVSSSSKWQLFKCSTFQIKKRRHAYMYTSKHTCKSIWCTCRKCSHNIPIPKWVLILAYLAVPVRFLFSLYGICWCVRGSLYFFANPKSIMYTKLPFFPSPIRKLSGLISRWMKFLEWTYSILLI